MEGSLVVSLGGVAVLGRIVSSKDFARTTVGLNVAGSAMDEGLTRLRRRLNIGLVAHSAQGLNLARRNRVFCRTDIGILSVVRRARLRLATGRGLVHNRLGLTVPMRVNRGIVSSCVGDFLVHCPRISIGIRVAGETISVVNSNVSLCIRVNRVGSSSLITEAVSFSRHVVITDPRCLGACKSVSSPRSLSSPRRRVGIIGTIGIPGLCFGRMSGTVHIGLPCHLGIGAVATYGSTYLDNLNVTSLPRFLYQRRVGGNRLIRVLPS